MDPGDRVFDREDDDPDSAVLTSRFGIGPAWDSNVCAVTTRSPTSVAAALPGVSGTGGSTVIDVSVAIGTFLRVEPVATAPEGFGPIGVCPAAQITPHGLAGTVEVAGWHESG